MGRHDDRIALAREFGATDVVSERGEDAVERGPDGYRAMCTTRFQAVAEVPATARRSS